jgi:hypothetical protein
MASDDAGEFARAKWDLLPCGGYMWATVQTVCGCPKHCSFCSGVADRRPEAAPARGGCRPGRVDRFAPARFRFVVLADDNFYPVTLTDVRQAARRADPTRLSVASPMRPEVLPASTRSDSFGA